MEEPLTLPSIHAFPPFFTRQPNAQIYETQKTTWTNLILNYYRSNRLWRIDVNQETIEKIPIFSNNQIQRTPPRRVARLILGKIKMEFLQELVNGMVENGQAEWVGKNTRVQALLFWYKPEEWANMISSWVNPRHFYVQGIILTFRSMRRDRRIQC
jgi:ESCRT-II complex subunit VPS25